MSITKRIKELQLALPPNVKLVAVSKFKTNAEIMEAYEAGQRSFGENYVQELLEKAESLPKDIEWHFIGHLQSNKVKFIASFISVIHSVDSYKLLKEINKEGRKHNRVINCLIQIQIADEETKTGMPVEDFLALVKSGDVKTLEHVKILGVMGMSTLTDNMNKVRNEFKELAAVKTIAQSFESGNMEMKEVSMGMSSDWELAIEEGSTIVRVGSGIFGARN